MPSASHMSMTADESGPTSSADKTVTNIEMADEMRMEENTDDLWTEETADSMRTEETGEEVATGLDGDNTIGIIRGPHITGVPFSCVRCGHQSFQALCRESEMAWAVRCLHCYLIQPILPIYV